MKAVCFGDSLTFGNIGYSYRKYVEGNHHLVNKGINGDTTIHVYERMERYLKKKQNQTADLYIVAVGTNDIMLPYLETVSWLWGLQMAPRIKMMKCIINDRVFEQEYEKILLLLQKYQRPGILIGIPMTELIDFPKQTILRRNQILKRLAKKYNVPFIDPCSLQQKAVRNTGHIYTWKHKNLLRVLDAIIMTLLPFTKDWFGRIRHLNLTVDGLHFNSLSAKLVGDAVTKAIQKYE